MRSDELAIREQRYAHFFSSLLSDTDAFLQIFHAVGLASMSPPGMGVHDARSTSCVHMGPTRALRQIPLS